MWLEKGYFDKEQCWFSVAFCDDACHHLNLNVSNGGAESCSPFSTYLHI